MKQEANESASGSARPKRGFGLRHAVVALAVTVVTLWAGIAFVQEAYLGHRLDQQVSALRAQNAVLAAQNQAYRKDVATVQSGAAAEEQARLNGYSKPFEHIYLVTIAPSPSPSPSTTPSRSPSPSPTSH